jgi:predicted small metal-binding protein
MAKTFQCRDGGVVCRTKLRSETEDELLQKAVAHAQKKHGVNLLESETLARYAASLIRDE